MPDGLRRGGVLAAVLTLAGCASAATVNKVADRPVLEVAVGETARPIQFRKIVVKLNRGEDIGSVQSGIFCMPHADLIWRGGRSNWGGDELTETFQEELKKANYIVVGDPDALFDDPDAWKAEFLVAGMVRSVQANICYPFAGLGNMADGTGEASLSVDWQIYSRLDRQVVYKTSTAGHGERREMRPDVEADIFLDAFAQATRQLLADRGFHELVTGKETGPAMAGPTPLRLTLTSARLFDRPLPENVGEIRRNVVTLFAGDGHGSGFFIDGKGHLLTNEHVVRRARQVTIRTVTGREIVGEVLATDPQRDVALVKAEETGVSGLPLRSDAPGVGAEVYAVGTPIDKALSATVSKGIVSAHRNRDGLDFIQSDANILPGNSGGPLLDANGNVVGIAVERFVYESAPTGLNLFIPIEGALDRLGIRRAGGT